MKDVKQLKRELNKIRVEQGMNYSELAKLISKDTNNTRKILTNDRDIKLCTVFKIMKALGINELKF